MTPLNGNPAEKEIIVTDTEVLVGRGGICPEQESRGVHGGHDL